MKSKIVKRSIFITGHKTSVSLEDEFWNALKEIAGGSGTTLSDLVGRIKAQRQHGNLSSALRLFVLEYYRGKAEKPGDEMLGQQSPPSAPLPAISRTRLAPARDRPQDHREPLPDPARIACLVVTVRLMPVMEGRLAGHCGRWAAVIRARSAGATQKRRHARLQQKWKPVLRLEGATS